MEFSKIALQAFFMLAESLAPVAFSAAVEAIKEKVNNKSLDKAIDVLDELITANVTAAELTLKNEAIKALDDGKIDKSEFSSIADVVKNNVLDQLNKDTKKILVENIDDFQDYLTDKTEKVLDIVKSKAMEDGTLDIEGIFKEGLASLRK